MLSFLINFFKFGWALILALPDIVGIVKYILKLGAQYQLANERRTLMKEFKEGMKENVEKLDNTRLVNLLNPQSEPLPRVSVPPATSLHDEVTVVSEPPK